MQHPKKQEMREILRARFAEIELMELCDIMDVLYSELSGTSNREKVFRLIEYCERRGTLGKLWDAMVKQRPDLTVAADSGVPRSALRHYLESQVEDLSRVDFSGYVAGVRLTTNLEQAFVDPALTEPVPLQPVIGLKRIDLLDQRPSIGWMNLLDYGKRHIILGPLGSGKTCLLKRMFLWAAHDSLDMLDDLQSMPRIPIYLPFRRLQIPVEDGTGFEPLIRLIEERFEGKISWSQLETVTSSILLLCDGLNEVPEELHQSVATMIRKFLNRYPSVAVLIALRSDGFRPEVFDPEDNYVLSSVRPMPQGDRGDLIRKLFGVTRLATALNSATLGDVASAVTLRSLNDVMTTPLSVTVGLLAYLVKPMSMGLVETVIRERIVRLALGEWDHLKAARDLEPVPSDDLYGIADVACYLAYEVFKRSDESNVTQTEISIDVAAKRHEELGPFKSEAQARRDVHRIMHRLCRRSELLDCLGTFLAQNYRFRRKGDVILMTAIYLGEQIPAEARKQVLSERLTIPNWQPVVLTTFDLLFLRSRAEADRFINYLVEGDSWPRNEFAKRLHLAAQCLARSGVDALASAEDVISRIIEILDDKHQLVDLNIRIQMSEVLGQLGDPRIGRVVSIPEGEFIMGYDQFPSDRPVRKRRLPAFQIDVYPVTNAEFKRFIDDGGYQREELWDKDGWRWVLETGRRVPRYWTGPRFNKPNYPVVGVSWFEADAYARWAGKRLPTEEEWEKAARGIEGNYWPWGNAFNEHNLNCSDSAGQINGTTPIGGYPAGQSPFGVYDMAGNVSEWTADWYEPYDPRQAGIDSHYGKRFKVQRGGGWGWDLDFARCTCRVASPRTADYAVIGFRCAS